MPLSEKLYDQIAEALVTTAYCILPEYFSTEITLSLYKQSTKLTTNEFSVAGIGRNDTLHLDQQIRSDKTLWLSHDNMIDRLYLEQMEILRNQINQRLYMGLFKYEAHYAHYGKGTFYHRHLDAFKGQSNRVLTTLFYLNKDWQPTDGGELLLYHPDTNNIQERVQPNYGKFILFLSEKFPHEVLTTNRDRFSIAGWFHINNVI